MTEFLRQLDIGHVRQPTDSELCFAAIIAAVTTRNVNQAHKALVDSFISESDGSTAAPWEEKAVTIEDTTVKIEPAEDASDPEGVISLIADQFEVGKPVALLYKKTDDAADERYHWSLLTGYAVNMNDKEKPFAIGVMDPLQPQRSSVKLEELSDMIERSIKFGGIFACALSIEQAK